MALEDQNNKSFPYSVYGDDLQPLGPIGIISEQLDPVMADSINRALRRRRLELCDLKPELMELPGFLRKDYRLPVDLHRFHSGEGKASILQSVRGHDLYIVTDVLNRGRYSNRFNDLSSLSPDEHFQDLVRLISATHGVTQRINVIMPYMYEGRRFRRQTRGSIDGAQMLKVLFGLGISNFITFEAPDPQISNAVPQHNFESFTTSVQIIEAMLQEVPDLIIDKEHLLVVSPSETSIRRAIYYSSIMKVPLCTFYRNYDKEAIRPHEVYGKSVGKKFLGDDVRGKDILLVDDMIDKGSSMLDCANMLKDMGARRIFIAVTYALFSQGYEQMNQAYDFGIVNKVFASNLYFHPQALRDMPWFCDVDFSPYIAKIVDSMNFDASLADLMSPTERINRLLAEHHQKQE